MYYELQFSARVFAHIVRNRLKALPLCVDQERMIEDPPESGQKILVVVDRVEIDDRQADGASHHGQGDQADPPRQSPCGRVDANAVFHRANDAR